MVCYCFAPKKISKNFWREIANQNPKMLYLEDYLESKYFLTCFSRRKILKNVLFFVVIEHLPSELRDRFFEIREMDLSVQSK